MIEPILVFLLWRRQLNVSEARYKWNMRSEYENTHRNVTLFLLGPPASVVIVEVKEEEDEIAVLYTMLCIRLVSLDLT
ncbi:hypothetical protein J6590_007544 [Homalodisca vitripennis]|nr:hypothetical protein J6590_007544 [Homalodisca vitripennis]